jgi:outer membrane protein insertion porin family
MRTFGVIQKLTAAMVLGTPVAIGALYVSAAPAIAQSGVIRDIAVNGNRRVDAQTVRTYLKFNVGDAYDAGKVDQSIRALFATGLFADVSITRTSSGVSVTVRENPVVNTVAFEGNSEVEKATLEGEVQLKSRSVYTRSKVQADVQRILDIYRRQGRFAAKVEPKLIELPDGRVNVVFEINEGGATKVKSISFVGNRAFNDGQLRDIITTSQSGLFDFLKGTNIYDPDRLALDRELLRQYYLKNGYADVRIVSANAELDRDGSGFFITFVVEEGPLFKFGTVNIDSKLGGVNVPGLQSEILTQSGALFDLSAMDRTTEKLTLAVSEQGVAFARVRPQTTRDATGQAINVTYLIDEGPRVYIERINVNGNQRTQDYVIRREFRLAEGDAFNPLMVERAKKRLQNLGFFKTVDVKRRQGGANDRVVLDVDLVEQSTGELSFGAGYSTAEGVIGDVSLTERNLLGRGQFVRLRLAGSAERLQVDLSFTEPRFLDRNIAAGFDIFHKGTTVSKSTPFATMKTGGSLRLGFPLGENFWMHTNYTLSYDVIKDVDFNNASRAIVEAANLNEGKNWTSSTGLNLTYDARNHPSTPTRGFFLTAGTDFAGLGGDVRYVRTSGEARGYYPVTEKVTFVARAAAGHIMGWGGDDVRLLDLFQKGGETVRGFGQSGYGPRDLVVQTAAATFDANGNQLTAATYGEGSGSALGGSTYWTTTAELRFPIPVIPDELGISGAVFADAGSLFGAGATAKSLNTQCGAAIPNGQTGVCLADSSSIRASVGASLLWNSPLGPLRLDIAKALKKEDYDKTQLIRFGASTKF